MENELKKRIMRRVYAIWFVRKAAPLAGEFVGLAVLFLWGLKYNSPASIMTNAISASDSVYAFFLFFVRSFTILSPATQFSFVAAGIIAILIARDFWLQGERLLTFRGKFSPYA